ncbi:MAG TPA: DUF692 family protein [Thermoanaerobaculia bacterium]|jgi:hypothetical protein
MRFGIGWRPELGAAILAHLDRIDVVEVLAEEFADASDNVRRALKFLATQVPVVVHGTSLGLASTELVDRKRLDAVARVLDWLQPESWSEHLAFVRAGRIEIGHLAAPPRNDATLEGLHRNLEIVRRVTGRTPLLENVASLIEPPLCTYDEGEWLAAIGCNILLDLHNLYANSINFGFGVCTMLHKVPRERVRQIHLAGGRMISATRLLDDHLHAVPDALYPLLGEVAPEDVTVILERDGNYPAFSELLAELEQARDACLTCSSS